MNIKVNIKDLMNLANNVKPLIRKRILFENKSYLDRHIHRFIDSFF